MTQKFKRIFLVCCKKIASDTYDIRSRPRRRRNLVDRRIFGTGRCRCHRRTHLRGIFRARVSVLDSWLRRCGRRNRRVHRKPFQTRCTCLDRSARRGCIVLRIIKYFLEQFSLGQHFIRTDNQFLIFENKFWSWKSNFDNRNHHFDHLPNFHVVPKF